MNLDRFTKTLLIVIAAFLGVLALRPIAQPTPVRAQADTGYPFYVEPGYTTLRKPDGTAQLYGKMVIDMSNGDIWGFPTIMQSPYPIDTTQTKPTESSPMYLGRFLFKQATRSGGGTRE